MVYTDKTKKKVTQLSGKQQKEPLAELTTQPIFWAFWAEKSRRAGCGQVMGSRWASPLHVSSAHHRVADAPRHVGEVLTDMLGWKLLDQIKSWHRKVLRDAMYTFHGDSFEDHVCISLQFSFFYQKRKTHMYRIAYINISCSRIITDEVVRVLEKNKKTSLRKTKVWIRWTQEGVRTRSVAEESSGDQLYSHEEALSSPEPCA